MNESKEIEQAKLLLKENGYRVVSREREQFLNQVWDKYMSEIKCGCAYYGDTITHIRRLTLIAIGKRYMTQVVSDGDRKKARDVAEDLCKVFLMHQIKGEHS